MKRPFGVLAENATADFALLLLEPVRSAEPAKNSIGIAAAIASIAVRLGSGRPVQAASRPELRFSGPKNDADASAIGASLNLTFIPALRDISIRISWRCTESW